MMRRSGWGVLCLLIAAGAAVARQDAQAEKTPPAVAALLEDDADALIDTLNNPGASDGSVAARDDQSFFAGTSSLTVTPFQRFSVKVPGWNFPIVENPGPGQYRYVRFAWKRTEAPGIMLQFCAGRTWHRYFAGTLSPRTQAWGVMTRVSEEVPRQWEVVTRDLFADFGPTTITGISFSALEGGGQASFDHIYLGQTIDDLDRVTAAMKAGTGEPVTPPAAGARWLVPAVAAVGVAAALLLVLFAWARRWKGHGTVEPESGAKVPAVAGQAADAGADASRVSFSCSACGKHIKARESLTGKRTKCPGCGHALVVP